MHNPWMSLWLSAANSWAGAVRSFWIAELHRQQTAMANEMIRQPIEYLRIECPVCGSRSGWANYALSGLAVFMDRGRHFRTGVNVKMYRGHTEGDPLGAAPGVRTRDHWLQIFGEIGVSF